MEEKRALLKRYFGHAAFRGGQEALIDAILSGRDVLGVMPTGGCGLAAHFPDERPGSSADGGRDTGGVSQQLAVVRAAAKHLCKSVRRTV